MSSCELFPMIPDFDKIIAQCRWIDGGLARLKIFGTQNCVTFLSHPTKARGVANMQFEFVEFLIRWRFYAF